MAKKNHSDMRLTIEFIPPNTHGWNVRSEVSEDDWDLIRRHIYQQANYRCEICHGRGPKWPVECHEVWSYDVDKGIQTLVKLQALCPLCHQCKHLGRANKLGKLKECLKHFRKVNRIRTITAERIVQEAIDEFQERDVLYDKLDIKLAKDLLKQIKKETRAAKALPKDMTGMFKKGGKRL